MNEPTRYSSRVLASLFGVTDRRIRQLAQQGIISGSVGGKYELIGSIQGYVRYLSASRHEDEGATYYRERALLVRAQRIAAERENEIAESQLVPSADAEVEIAALTKQMVDFLEALPGVLEQDGGLTDTQVGRMRELVDQERERFRRKLP